MQKFLEVIRTHSPTEGRDGDLCIANDGPLHVEYAPFDHIEKNAKIAIVGLTPGRNQARNARNALREAWSSGRPMTEAMALAKRSASFSGAMRSNLLAILDHIGLPNAFGMQKSEEFFSLNGAGVHFTSALRYPVFLNENNYSGSPHLITTPILREMIDIYLAEEASTLSEALWIPVGKHAAAALFYLADAGKLDRARIISGLPHPSGANSERIAYFLEKKSREKLSNRTNPDIIDDARKLLKAQVKSLSKN